MLRQILLKYVYDPIYFGIYKGFNAWAYSDFLSKSQWNPLDKNIEIQKQLLFALLKHAEDKIPYYQKLFKHHQIHLNPNNIFRVMSDIPILTKDIIRKNFDQLNYFNKHTRWHYNTSGGSTGEPVRFIQDYPFENKMMVSKRFQKSWTNYKPGDPLIKLWGSEQEVFKQKKQLKSRISSWANNTYLMNAFMMDETRMASYVNEINNRKPKLIVAYAQSANELAKYILSNHLAVYSPESVLTSAGVLYPDFRTNIEKAFNCMVFDRYGSREVGDMACECDKHNGLHINLFTHYIEILDKNLNPCIEGEPGEVYVTVLTNYTMPLIRYKIGDMAVFTQSQCPCGRGLPLIKNIVGRDVDIFINDKNQFIDGEYFTHLFYFKNYIDRFQVIQKSPSFVIVKIQTNKTEGRREFQKDKKEIADKIRIVMGDACRINFLLTDLITPSQSGKYRYTIRDF